MSTQTKVDGNDYQRLVEQETLIVDATELVCEMLDESGIAVLMSGGRRQAGQQWHATVEAAHDFGVGFVDGRSPRAVQAARLSAPSRCAPSQPTRVRRRLGHTTAWMAIT